MTRPFAATALRREEQRPLRRLGGMITATDVEIRAGARTLLDGVTFRVAAGDKIGLVGRNGAGKTTLTKVLAGEAQPAAGTVTSSRARSATCRRTRAPATSTCSPRNRMLSARGLDALLAELREARGRDGRAPTTCAATPRCAATARIEERFHVARRLRGRVRGRLGSPPASGCPTRVLEQPLGTLSGGQRRRVELARILFSGAETLLLDEPTNHLDADSIVWLRDFLKRHRGGLDRHQPRRRAARAGRQQGLPPRRQPRRARPVQRRLEGLPAASARSTSGAASASGPTPRRRPRCSRSQADKHAGQGDQGPGGAQHGPPGRNGCSPASSRCARSTGWPSCASPTRRPAARRRSPPAGCPSRTGRSRSSPTSTWPSTGVPGWSCSGSTAPARPRCCGCSAASRQPDTGEVVPGHGLRLGYYAQEHDTLDTDRTVLENMASPRPTSPRSSCAGCWAPSCSPATWCTSRPARSPAARRPGWHWRRWSSRSANVLLLDEPTNNLDPASREEVLDALRTYGGAIVLVTHDEGAVEALSPDKVILLPDGVEDLWSDELVDLVALA